jgi:hypothetical protein
MHRDSSADPLRLLSRAMRSRAARSSRWICSRGATKSHASTIANTAYAATT